MFEVNKNNHNNRFFSHSSILKKPFEEWSTNNDDPTPFGLHLQEAFPDNQLPENGFSISQSPTNTPTGTDTCLDVDYES